MRLLFDYALFEKRMTAIAIWMYYVNLLGTSVWNFGCIYRGVAAEHEPQHPSGLESLNFLLLVASPLSCFISSAVLLRIKLARHWNETTTATAPISTTASPRKSTLPAVPSTAAPPTPPLERQNIQLRRLTDPQSATTSLMSSTSSTAACEV